MADQSADRSLSGGRARSYSGRGSPARRYRQDHSGVERGANSDPEPWMRSAVAKTYYNRPDKDENNLSAVEDQCSWLRKIGFSDVDCFLRSLSWPCSEDGRHLSDRMHVDFGIRRLHRTLDRFEAQEMHERCHIPPPFRRATPWRLQLLTRRPG